MQCHKKNRVECPCCGGGGELPDYTRYGISDRIDPPVKRCAFCNGSGTVTEDEAEGFEEGRDYAREEREEAALRRWEERREEGR